MSEQKARDLMAAIRYQVFRPEVTTMGACATEGCHRRARGSGTCADCLGYELDDILGIPAGSGYVEACKAQRWAERAVLDAAGGDDERG